MTFDKRPEWGDSNLTVHVQTVFTDWILRVRYAYYFLYCTPLDISSTTDPHF